MFLFTSVLVILVYSIFIWNFFHLVTFLISSSNTYILFQLYLKYWKLLIILLLVTNNNTNWMEMFAI